MVWKRWVAMVVVGVAAFAGTPGSGAGGQTDDEEIGGRRCSVATLRGGYGIQIQGTRPAAPPAPAGTIESVIGIDRFVIVDHGREVRHFVVSPTPLMITGVSTKM